MLKIRKKLAEKKEASKGIAKAGFTLIELLVVLAILAILVLLAAPRFLGYTKDAEVRTMQADAKVLANAALIYNVESETDSWPVVDDTVIATIKQGTDEIKVVAIDGDKLKKKHVQTLRNDFKEYGVVTEGDQAGNVYHIGKYNKKTNKVTISTEAAGVKDKDGNKYFGVDLVDLVDLDDDAVEVTAPVLGEEEGA